MGTLTFRKNFSSNQLIFKSRKWVHFKSNNFISLKEKGETNFGVGRSHSV
ncbi:hypothetical protein LEP1GSC064_2088 [Leptospira kirschneri serovar Grippotyphosa str. Moskva]|nr:hypothetical protein LEP1GSC044_2789 [Leptospira kirschneri serovar Grippotyphosa str. RM52]EKQ82390.1 hypothetical protein LEP1GSC064_2088 [Leptospira kirschneri serovar Grippotyphosa str. Moskva]EKR07493.1 hypothetical protein LEP1GSC122_2717 [Leptospira kirschneri serovar Valbuzzi str. 200702274]EMK06198.1 hypothetical protein LEP1GSC176_2960 [Leptospira kirschneri str. MMD1493]EMO81263.1 hypothetical protein LEP1GSC126_2647 [Leptospira kirschneri str. 200801774]